MTTPKPKRSAPSLKAKPSPATRKPPAAKPKPPTRATKTKAPAQTRKPATPAAAKKPATNTSPEARKPAASAEKGNTPEPVAKRKPRARVARPKAVPTPPVMPDVPQEPELKPPPPKPEGVGSQGGQLWRAVVEDFDLRPDELTVLESASRAADRLKGLRDELKKMEIMITGSTGQMVVNPLYAEIRAHEAHIASLFARLKLKEAAGMVAGGTGEKRSVSARAKANSRWATPHGHSA